MPSKTTIKIVWGEMDALGHLNNTVYIRHIETARVEYFHNIGLAGDWSKGIGPILLSINCRFIQPVVFPDNLIIETRTSKIGNTSLILQHDLYSDKLGKVAQGESVCVLFDYNTNEKISIPDTLRKSIESVDGQT